MNLRRVIVAKMNPVLTNDMSYLGDYGYALRTAATLMDDKGATRWADEHRERAYYLRTLAR